MITAQATVTVELTPRQLMQLTNALGAKRPGSKMLEREYLEIARVLDAARHNH